MNVGARLAMKTVHYTFLLPLLKSPSKLPEGLEYLRLLGSGFWSAWIRTWPLSLDQDGPSSCRDFWLESFCSSYCNSDMRQSIALSPGKWHLQCSQWLWCWLSAPSYSWCFHLDIQNIVDGFGRLNTLTGKKHGKWGRMSYMYWPEVLRSSHWFTMGWQHWAQPFPLETQLFCLVCAIRILLLLLPKGHSDSSNLKSVHSGIVNGGNPCALTAWAPRKQLHLLRYSLLTLKIGYVNCRCGTFVRHFREFSGTPQKHS